MRLFHVFAALAATSLSLGAQGSPFQTPGMPVYNQQGPPQDSGQADRFTSLYNPALSFIVDTIVDWENFGDSTLDDGFSSHLRVMELAGNSWVDPYAWAYFVGAADEEAINIEEAAIHYTGLGGHSTIRAGRFFIDFGKQMQVHIHELRTLERPLTLRAFLGEEVKGEGAQWDDWTSIGNKTVVRWSIGAFNNTLPEKDEFPASDSAGEPLTRGIADRKDGGDFAFTARVTGFADVGESGVFQVGASLRDIPNYSLTDATDNLTQNKLSNQVWGADVTYGWTGETGQNKLTVGGEYLASTGDTAAVVTDPDGTPGNGDETLSATDDTLTGWFAWGDYAFSRYDSTGLQYSTAELPDGNKTRATEIEAYFTHVFSEFHRLRLSVISADETDSGNNDLRIALNYTATLGAHGHGVSF